MKKHVKVALELSGKSVMDLVGFANEVIANVGASSYFATPHPALSVVSSAALNLQTAIQAQGGGTAKTELIRTKRELLETRLTELGHYVEDIANTPGNEEIAELIILSAGMQIRQVTPRQKVSFSVEPSGIGAVKLSAERVARGSHQWEYTTTPDVEASWTDASLGTKAVIIIHGLASAVRYYFRHRAVLKSGPTAWDGPVSTVVL